MIGLQGVVLYCTLLCLDNVVGDNVTCVRESSRHGFDLTGTLSSLK
jgi:hypothetical protein